MIFPPAFSCLMLKKVRGKKVSCKDFEQYLQNFTLEENLSLIAGEDKKTKIEDAVIDGDLVKYFINEFWTSGQRKASALHEISYRACFKPQLPRFFIEELTREGDLVYDPFMGRGTTLIEAAILNRRVAGNDINPLSRVLAEPRLNIPGYQEIAQRVAAIPLDERAAAEMDLSMFYHPRTEGEIVSLRCYLDERRRSGEEDDVDRWIRMVATNRLTGHSPGFFSVYTLPPNQAVSPERQLKINAKRNQQPEYRNVKSLILKKTRALLKDITEEKRKVINKRGKEALFFSRDARFAGEIPAESVQLTVTSPPFLDVVQYSSDNWLRCWFNGIDEHIIEKQITITRNIGQWESVMQGVFEELYRVTAVGGWVAFEVGEVKGGRIKLEEHVVPLGKRAGFCCLGVIINKQLFTKTSNIWGIGNNTAGTNTNRIVLFHKK